MQPVVALDHPRRATASNQIFLQHFFSWQSEAISWQSEASEKARRRAIVGSTNRTRSMPVSANRGPAKTVIVIAKKGMVPS
jgi:hypothetical protein